MESLTDEITEARIDERQQALVDVSGILGWLFFDPPQPMEDLRKWVIAEFKRAASTLPEDSTIHRTLEHYTALLKP
jgi:hypothetical protein